jgi:hypothetical protein
MGKVFAELLTIHERFQAYMARELDRPCEPWVSACNDARSVRDSSCRASDCSSPQVTSRRGQTHRRSSPTRAARRHGGRLARPTVPATTIWSLSA